VVYSITLTHRLIYLVHKTFPTASSTISPTFHTSLRLPKYFRMASSTQYTALLDPPPPYEEVVTNVNADVDPNTPTHETYVPDLKNSSNNAQEEWKYIKRDNPTHTHYSTSSCWFKYTRDPIDNTVKKIHLGVSKHDEQKGVCEGPDAFFTCMLQPRWSIVSIRFLSNVVARVAVATKWHRGREDEYCDCVLWNKNESTTHCLSNGAWPPRFILWLDWMLLKIQMKKHDWLCSCACFDSRV
jgi:hypothetical protein